MISLICLVIFPFLIWQALKTIRMAKESAGWSTTSGVVTGSTTKKVSFRVQPRVRHDQCSVGKRYMTGYKVTKDPAEAAKWFQKSADQGDAEAQDWLGMLYAKGLGVTKNYDEALSLFHKSAGQGNKLACVSLGRMYDKGEGVPQDHQQAVQWYQQAKGDPQAEAMMKKLGVSTAP